jgi:glyoxylase-like metal-dependent hydrolase (beta-lactamase superfamily II)
MRKPFLSASLLLALVASGAAAQDFDKVQIKTSELRGGTYLLTGAGGNMVASTGDDGTFLVDDQYAPLSGRISAALGEIGRLPLRFVINTHWHGDHTGGNEAFGGEGAVIIAHANVRKRMSSEQFIAAFGSKVEASPEIARPVVTFTRDIALHLNGNDVQVVHVADAHTDGDALVKFAQANVLHMGDTWFNGGYPFIDLSSGGSIDGLVRGLERGLELSDAQTLIVPGHGPVGDRAALQAYRDLLQAARARIAALKASGASKDQAIAAAPTVQWDEAYGKGFIKPAQFVGFVYDSLPADGP